MPEKQHVDLSQMSRNLIQMDYAFAFQQKQVIFITYAQNLYSQLRANDPDLQSIFANTPNFGALVQSMTRDSQFSNKFCLCIDLVSVFLDEIDQTEFARIDMFSYSSFDKKDFIMVKKQNHRQIECYQDCGRNVCACKVKLFSVRPYTYEFLNCIKSFYEIVGGANLPAYEVEQIIKTLE